MEYLLKRLEQKVHYEIYFVQGTLALGIMLNKYISKIC